MIFVVTSVVLLLSWSHWWCYDCCGSIGGVMIVVVHRWCYDCRGHIGGVIIVVVTSVVL
jgi:hypothetical protein